MGHNVFVYGTLLADEVVKLLLERVPKSKSATLTGYKRFGLKGRVYPALRHAARDNKVEGKIFLDLSDRELHILDEYEDDDYYRERVSVQVEGSGELEALVYVWKDAVSYLLEGEWDYKRFRALHFKEYFGMCEEYAEEIHEDLAGSNSERVQE